MVCLAGERTRSAGALKKSRYCIYVWKSRWCSIKAVENLEEWYEAAYCIPKSREGALPERGGRVKLVGSLAVPEAAGRRPRDRTSARCGCRSTRVPTRTPFRSTSRCVFSTPCRPLAAALAGALVPPWNNSNASSRPPRASRLETLGGQAVPLPAVDLGEPARPRRVVVKLESPTRWSPDTWWSCE
jgi:hypothetical protein